VAVGAMRFKCCHARTPVPHFQGSRLLASYPGESREGSHTAAQALQPAQTPAAWKRLHASGFPSGMRGRHVAGEAV